MSAARSPFAAAYTAARAAIRCTVMRQYLLFLSGVPEGDVRERLRGILETLARQGLPRASRDVQYRRAMILVDHAVRRVAPLDLEAHGAPERAAILRALPRLNGQQRCQRTDRVLAKYEGVGQATAHAASAAGLLGDLPRPSMSHKRVFGVSWAGHALIDAAAKTPAAWAAGLDAFVAALRLDDREGA